MSPLPPALPVDATGEPCQTRPPDAPANKSADGAATCYRGRQRTVGRARLALAVWTGYLCLIQSGAFAARPTTHETRERPALGDECRTSLPRVSSGSRTRTYNPTINSRLRRQLRHAGMIKHYVVLAASARRESNPHHPLRRRMLCPLSYRRLSRAPVSSGALTSG